MGLGDQVVQELKAKIEKELNTPVLFNTPFCNQRIDVMHNTNCKACESYKGCAILAKGMLSVVEQVNQRIGGDGNGGKPFTLDL